MKYKIKFFVGLMAVLSIPTNSFADQTAMLRKVRENQLLVGIADCKRLNIVLDTPEAEGWCSLMLLSLRNALLKKEIAPREVADIESRMNQAMIDISSEIQTKQKDYADMEEAMAPFDMEMLNLFSNPKYARPLEKRMSDIIKKVNQECEGQQRGDNFEASCEIQKIHQMMRSMGLF